jgi:hypothetical protein
VGVCRVHFARNLLALIPKSHKDMVAALFRTIFRVNGSRKLTPSRKLKTDPLGRHGSSLVAAGTRPRLRSLSR